MSTQVLWEFRNVETSTEFTDDVLSASVNIGRQTYMDVYNGGSLMVSINNNTNAAAGFQVNNQIQLSDPVSGYSVIFWVDEIQFSDHPGNTGLSTATIICSDAVTRLGRRLATNVTLTQTTAALQAEELNEAMEPTIVSISGVSNGSEVSATTYSGAPMQRINQLISTERGIISNFGTSIAFFSRTAISSIGVSAITFGRSASSTQIGYQEFSRTALGQNFMNNVTVTPTGGAEQIGQNQESIDLYGSNYYSVSSEDATNAQALGLAQWLANSQSDPSSLRFEVGFTDRSQTEAAMDAFPFLLMEGLRFQMNWRVPGAVSDVSVGVIMEGYSLSITPSETDFRIYFSPITLYQFFTLDSATLGVLDTSRLGW
jgi:hypothetical protein